MVVAGPNGSGKSTLLNAIRTACGYSQVMYVGPHRAMRRQQVQQRHLLVSPISFESLLAGQNVPGFEGIRMLDSSRDPWNYDDSANYLKHALCQIEVERGEAIKARYDRDKSIPPETIPDPWTPLRTLTGSLLPHLAFASIDTSNRGQVQCLWKVHGLDVLVDLDDLSSGEKSVIQMFYPLVEREIRHLLAQIGAGPEPGPRPELCVLIDEPELHLHPNLQLKVLDYLRVLTSGTQTQVIVATHSPTIVEYASYEELFLLRPIELVSSEDNQLVRVATDDDRLRILREIFGSTTNLTALQPIVVVEGANEVDSKSTLPDRKIYRALHASFDAVTLIPGGGKGECKSLTRAINEHLSVFSKNLRAIALLDRDSDEAGSDPRIHLLPVAMIENFLLDPDAIWETIQSVLERTPFRNVDDIAAAIAKVLDDVEIDEAERRAGAALGSAHFYPKLPASEIPTIAAAFVRDVAERYSNQTVAKAVEVAHERVRTIKATSRRREEFHGKAVLNEFYKRHLHQTGLAKPVFTFEAARHARRRKAVVAYFDTFFEKLVSGQ